MALKTMLRHWGQCGEVEARHGWQQSVGLLRGCWLGWAGSLGIVFLLSACQAPPPPPLMVGMNSWIGYDPLVLARDRDLIDRAQIKVVELSSSSETLRSFRNGLIDAAALTLDEALRLREAGMDVRVVAVLDVSAGGDMVVAHPSITSPAALRGQFVAVEDSSVGALLLQRMLQGAGLTRTDVKVVNLESNQHLRALQDGQVSAPFRTEAGWHIVQRIGTRQVNATDQTRRAQISETIGRRKLEDEWNRFLRELRGEAFVDVRGQTDTPAAAPATGG